MANQSAGQQVQTANGSVEQQGQGPVEQQGSQAAVEQQASANAVEPVEQQVVLAVWSAEEMQHAIYDAVRDELESELTDDEIAGSLRMTDKYVIQGPDGAALVEFEVGRPYPGLEPSRIVGIFMLPGEDSVPGDVRIYVAVPTLPVAGLADHLCFTFNRATMTTRRERMVRDLFVEEVAEEMARTLPEEEDEETEEGEEGEDTPPDEDGVEDDEDTDEVPACAKDDCDTPVAFACTCQVCSELPIGARFFSCVDHRGELAGEHLREKDFGRPPRWQKLPAPALAVAPPVSR